MNVFPRFAFAFFACFLLLSCTDDQRQGRVIVTTGVINMDEVVLNQDASVAFASGSVIVQGDLPEDYEIVTTGVIYGVDSTELKIASYQRYDAPGHYDNYLGIWRDYNYQAIGRGVVVNIILVDGDISSFNIRESYGDCDFVCPLINLPRGTKLFLCAFAHISNELGDDIYLYGATKEFISPGIYQDPTVYTEITALGIGVYKQDIDIHSGLDAQIYCTNYANFYQLGGYSDWRVPTLNELEEIYKLRNNIGGFSAAKYFSSQLWETSDIYYWYWDFATNSPGHEDFYGYSSQSGKLRLVRDILK